jgi:hypothetical protein
MSFRPTKMPSFRARFGAMAEDSGATPATSTRAFDLSGRVHVGRALRHIVPAMALFERTAAVVIAAADEVNGADSEATEALGVLFKDIPNAMEGDDASNALSVAAVVESSAAVATRNALNFGEYDLEHESGPRPVIFKLRNQTREFVRFAKYTCPAPGTPAAAAAEAANLQAVGAGSHEKTAADTPIGFR